MAPAGAGLRVKFASRPSPAGTTRGFKEDEFREIADLIVEVVDGLAINGPDANGEVEEAVKAKVAALCARFPLYPNI